MLQRMRGASALWRVASVSGITNVGRHVRLPCFSTQLVQQRHKSVTISANDVTISSSDERELKAYSLELMNDSLVDISPEESAQYIVPVPHDERERTPLQTVVYKIYGQHQELERGAFRLGRLCMERLENESLCKALKIEDSFNHRAYFYTLHMWLVHSRLMMEGWKGERVDDYLFEEVEKMWADWLNIKGVEPHRFHNELRNVQEFMYSFCVHLDMAMQDRETVPARIRQVLWAHMYNSELDPDDQVLDLATKYTLRQLLHCLQLETPYFMGGQFVWANLPVAGVKRTRVIPAFQQPMKFFGLPMGRSRAMANTGLNVKITGQEERKLKIAQKEAEEEHKKLEERRKSSRPALITGDGRRVANHHDFEKLKQENEQQKLL